MGNTVVHSFMRSSLPVKRKSHTFEHESLDSEEEDYTLSPKRRKVMSTTRYVYQALFEEGQGSDVRIAALNRTWNLHRLYLSQAQKISENKMRNIFQKKKEGGRIFDICPMRHFM
ncbi:unnamed protein product [Larinioides sclopetarius]|uniref:Uncharacterized protein n=1 Tax=Larinioides sclopetarius TaxID=280406 RepID=A0AAV2A695_9ARAC